MVLVVAVDDARSLTAVGARGFLGVLPAEAHRCGVIVDVEQLDSEFFNHVNDEPGHQCATVHQEQLVEQAPQAVVVE